MKWAIVILTVLGLVAGVSAAFLVGGLRTPSSSADNNRGSDADVTVMLAGKSLPAASVLTSKMVIEGTASQKEVPENYLTNPIQAIGRVLAVPVVEGQILTGSCFVTEGTGAQLAASLPEGMRAISVNLSSTVVTGGLLYPGCIVDVLVSFKLPHSKDMGEALSTTLLREVQVLAVEGTSVVSRSKDAEEKQDSFTKARSNYGRVTVTLMVDPRQAEALQLATEHGSISVAIRNPLDKGAVDTDVTVLSQGRLAMAGAALDPTVFAAGNGAGDSAGNSGDSTERLLGNPDPNSVRTGSPPKKSSSWLVSVIRGVDRKEESFDLGK